MHAMLYNRQAGLMNREHKVRIHDASGAESQKKLCEGAPQLLKKDVDDRQQHQKREDMNIVA